MNQTLPVALDGTFIRELLARLGQEARRHRFEVAPNPCVGAAVISGERVVGHGCHEIWGGPHAELGALAAAATSGVPRERWDTLAITLEPCSTTGKTGPCTEAILASGIPRVVVGSLDPDPRHRGKGLALLAERGVEVLHLEDGSPLSAVSPHFLRWTSSERLRRPRPWTIAKWAQTQSGHLSPPEDQGEGRWISSPASLAEVQLLRGKVDAILTGVGTVAADDPRLTVRPPGDTTHAPLRVVVDSVLRMPASARLLTGRRPGEGGGPVHVLCAAGASRARRRALEEAGASVHDLKPASAGGVNLRDVETWLWERDARRVLLEAGPTLLGAMLAGGLVDQLRVYTGAVRGGRGLPLGEWLSERRIGERLDRECGGDAVLEAFCIEPR